MNTAAREIVTSDGVVLRVMVIDDGEYLKRSGTTIVSDAGGGGGGGAPTGATYVTLTTNGSLTNERVLTAGSGVSITDAGAGSTVTVALADIATDRLLGRDTAGTGAPEALTVGGGVEFSGAGGIQRSALTGDVTAAAGSGSVTVDQARGLRETSGPTTLAMGAVTADEALIRSGTTVTSRAFMKTHTYNAATSTTLAPPSWALYAIVQVQGAGAGGVGGARANVGSSVSGGGGGGGGCLQEHSFDIASLPADKTLTIVVGAGGSGGAGASSNGNGGNGTDGNPSYVADSDAVMLAYARGGGNGSTTTGGSISTGDTEYDGSNGGNAGVPGSTPATVFRYSPAGGGGGGGITSGNSASNGGNGGWGGNARDPAGSTNGGAGGTTGGTRDGTNAAAQTGRRSPGGGGGAASGAGNGSVDGGNGGNGIAGSGGGGGGAAHAPATAGDGGTGGDGWIIVTFYG